MKNKTTVIDFLNLAELATECFFAALGQIKDSKHNENIDLKTKFKNYLLNNYCDSIIAVCVTCQKDQLDLVIQKLSIDKYIHDQNNPKNLAVVIDRIVVSDKKMDRIDQAIEYAQKFGYSWSIYIQSAENSWQELINPVFAQVNLNHDSKIEDSFLELSWDEVYERFSKPDRFYQFQRSVMQIFGFQLADKTSLKLFITNCKKYYSEKPEYLNQILEFCDQLEVIANLIVDSDIHKLPRKTLNILKALKAYILTSSDDLFVIDGPLPPSVIKKIKYNFDLGRVKNINNSSSTLNWSSLPKAQTSNLFWAITIPDSAYCYGSVSQYFGIADELNRFYSNINKNDYRGKSLQSILDGTVFEFIEIFANHPKFRGFSGIWKKMKLPNYQLAQRLEELSYPDALLMSVAKSASRIRENSVIIPAVTFEGIDPEVAKNHLQPVIEWCEHHRCYVY